MATFFSTQSNAIMAIRDESGTTKNENIGNDKVKKYQLIGYGEVFAVVASIYNISNLDQSNEDFAGSAAQSILSQIESLIGAGHLMKKELGAQGMQRFNTSNGGDKVKEGRDMLKMIADGVLRLYDVNGSEFAKTGGGMTGEPVISESSRTRQFCSDDKY